ncbi:ciliary microtubule inner protein 2B-like isoform X2 [Lineus longissimus]|uniref:ciliary microtubule inner protein 2B-like isoform X2 n=2 Tax=Lineus longissimus TaxID=88925 RepID=UPI00315D5CE1
MTSVAFGGGPTLEQRRAFAGLKDGTHVPGYRGYCPQIKYRMGKTYGQDTHELAQSTLHLQPSDPVRPRNVHPILHEAPEATGDNKYVRRMVPGYTGYVPTMPFRYGGTYKVMCDQAIDQYTTAMNQNDGKEADLATSKSAQPRLQPIAFDPEIKQKLDHYRDTHPTPSTLLEAKREFLEPPIPGYQGYIPKLKPTECGLGGRYHRTTGRSLQAFKNENTSHFEILQKPVIINSSYPDSAAFEGDNSRRLYQNDGMIPKYTGYLPQRRFVFGNTYGDTTRGLPVCRHELPSYGDHVRGNGRVIASAYL